MGLIAAKKSVFFTGSAGTGKSFLLQHILKIGRQAKRRVYATATTGIAAYNIGGMTLHHFAGLDTRPNASRADLLHQIQQKKDALLRWRDVEVLIIDEISMLDGRLFDDLEALARQLRRDMRFFGGIQLVLSGDFFQLPPVSRDRSDVKLCFESAAWRRGVRDIVVLKEVFRQTNQEFIDILNAFRVGQPTDKMVATLNERYSSSAELDWSAIHIFTHNNDVLQVCDCAKLVVDIVGHVVDSLMLFTMVSTDEYKATGGARRQEIQLRFVRHVRPISLYFIIDNIVCCLFYLNSTNQTLSTRLSLLCSGKKEYLSSCPAPPTISLKSTYHTTLMPCM